MKITFKIKRTHQAVTGFLLKSGEKLAEFPPESHVFYNSESAQSLNIVLQLIM